MTYKGQIVLSIIVMTYLAVSFLITSYDFVNKNDDKLKNLLMFLGSLLSFILVSNLV